MTKNSGSTSTVLAQAIAEMRATFDQRVRDGVVTDALTADEAATTIAAEVAEKFSLVGRDADALADEAMRYGSDEFPPSGG